MIAFLGSERVEFHSPLPPEECVRRIVAAIDIERVAIFSLSTLYGSRPVIGRVNGTSTRLRKRIAYSNSFQTILTAKMRAEGNGTAIEAELAVRLFTRIFVSIWFAGVIFGCVAFISVSLIHLFTHNRELAENNEWLALVIPPGMLIFGSFLVWFCRYLARDEARFLTDFLCKELHAEPR